MKRRKHISPAAIIGTAAVIILPILLVPASAQARPDGWRFFAAARPHNMTVEVRQDANEQKSRQRALRRLFDGSEPPRSRAKARLREKLRSARKARRAHPRAGGRMARKGYRGHFAPRHKYGSGRGYYDDYGYYDDGWDLVCATPRQIHRQLARQGWSHFHRLRIRPNVLLFKARQRNDLTYDLRIDRCSGILISARLQPQDRWVIRWLRRLVHFSWLR